MKIDFKSCNEEQLWKYVATHLKKKGIDTILAGGAVVSIYSEGAYKSGDLDLILAGLFTTGLSEAMKEIGFLKKGGRHYVHPVRFILNLENVSTRQYLWQKSIQLNWKR